MENGTRQKKQNADKIKNAVLRFFGFFVVLSVFSFSAVYLFFESYSIQRDSIRNDLNTYKAILNKQEVLKAKIDTLYYQMSLLNTGQVRNDVFLGKYISDNIQETKKMIGSDSISEFKHYNFLLSKMDTLLALKNDIIVITDKEQLALKDLNECMGKISKVKTELAQDPTRGFQMK